MQRVIKTQIGPTLQFKWLIEHFHALPEDTQHSPSFCVGTTMLFLELCPFGWQKVRLDKNSIGVYLRMCRPTGPPPEGVTLFFECTLTLLSADGAVLCRKPDQEPSICWRLSWPDVRWDGWRAMMPRVFPTFVSDMNVLS